MRGAEGAEVVGPTEAVVVRLGERFEQFYEREYHRVVGFAYAVAGSWEAAEDAAQEAFLRVHRDWGRVGRYDQPGAWVRRVAANLAISAFRRRLAEARALVHLAARRTPDPAGAARGGGLLAGGPVPAQPPAPGGRGTGGRAVQVDLGVGDRLVAVRSGSRVLLADPDQGVVRAIMPAPGSRGAGMAVDGGLIWLSDPARGRLLVAGPAALGRP
jgi:Sigma-70 region 2